MDSIHLQTKKYRNMNTNTHFRFIALTGIDHSAGRYGPTSPSGLMLCGGFLFLR